LHASSIWRWRGTLDRPTKRKAGADAGFPFSPAIAELATGLLGGFPLRALLCSLLRAFLSALTGTLFCSHLKLSIMEVLASPDPPVDRRDDDLHAKGAWVAATYASAETHEARVTTMLSYGVTQTGEVEISHLDWWNHDRLAGIAALARAHALRDAHRFQVVQHEDRRIIEPEILHRL